MVPMLARERLQGPAAFSNIGADFYPSRADAKVGPDIASTSADIGADVCNRIIDSSIPFHIGRHRIRLLPEPLGESRTRHRIHVGRHRSRHVQ